MQQVNGDNLWFTCLCCFCPCPQPDGSQQSKHEESSKSLGRGQDVAFSGSLGCRRNARSWNSPSKHGPHGELFFFLKNRADFRQGDGGLWARRSFGGKECEEHNVGNLPLEVVGQGWSGWLVHVLLEDWELARVAVSCHPASDLCQEMQDAWKSSHRRQLCCPPVAAFERFSHPGRAAAE